MISDKITLKELELYNFRNYDKRKFTFDSEIVVFSGINGIGKSNILEAIYYLSILRSFRTNSLRELVKVGEREFNLRAKINKGEYSETLDIEQGINGSRRLGIDGTAIRRSSEFIREFRAVVFAPEDKLITAGSSLYRRKFFDMLISVMDPNYMVALQRYGKALAQRNAALRNDEISTTAIAAFEPELAEAATYISPTRQKYVDLILKVVNELSTTEKFEIDINYQPDYPNNSEEYFQKLNTERARERKRGFTSFGPQTDEFEIIYNGKNLRNFGSNGQLRLVSLYLKMAEFAIIKELSNNNVVALVDDVTVELDLQNRNHFFDLLKTANQIFYTFTELPTDKNLKGAQVFNLE